MAEWPVLLQERGANRVRHRYLVKHNRHAQYDHLTDFFEGANCEAFQESMQYDGSTKYVECLK